MNRIFAFGFSLLACASFALTAAAEQAKQPTFSTDKVYRATLKMDYTKKPVTFSHKVHTNLSCASCHDEMPQHPTALVGNTKTRCTVCHHPIGDEVVLQACGECHDTSDKHAENSYFKVIHDRNYYGHDKDGVSCLGCHSSVIALQPERKKELTGCSGSACHPKAAK